VQFGFKLSSRPVIVASWSLLSLASLLMSHRLGKQGLIVAEVINVLGLVRNYVVYRQGHDDLHLMMLAIIGMTATASFILAWNAEHDRKQHQELSTMNARLGELALVDEQTGAYNHRFFDRRLAEEIARAARTGRGCSLLMIDIDHFKHYNDCNGHMMGDRALAKIAGVLQDNVRMSDTVARYGGEEFAVIVPEVSVEVAQALAQRLQRAVHDEPFPGEENQPQGRLTVSVGLSVYPSWAKTSDELVQQADEALYQAKHMSRNRVEVYADVVGQLKGDAAKTDEVILAAFQTLLSIISARDQYTYGHSQRVCRYAEKLGKNMGLDSATMQSLRWAAVVHDLGKIEIPKSILMKTGKLEPDEWAIVRQHPVWALRILEPIAKDFNRVIPIVRSHHERFDGAGYPDGISGEVIPLESRILAVADAFDAMRSNRPYREAMSVDEALKEIEASIGTQFDPAVAKAFLEMMNTSEPDSDLPLSLEAQ
jgi:diguanylate cyclase (GGDEF)-like protein